MRVLSLILGYPSNKIVPWSLRNEVIGNNCTSGAGFTTEPFQSINSFEELKFAFTVTKILRDPCSDRRKKSLFACSV